MRGKFGTVTFETPVTVDPGSTKLVKFDPSTTPALALQNPKLWWPNGYGEQNLYDVQLSFVAADKSVSDSKSFKAGVKQYTYSVDARPGVENDAGALKIWINGRRFIGRGGNWGFPEVLLRYRAREYDWAVRYHKDMNFTMIRNWVGQTGDDEFYDACDKYGIVVWQDFWLANPADGPIPDESGYVPGECHGLHPEDPQPSLDRHLCGAQRRLPAGAHQQRVEEAHRATAPRPVLYAEFEPGRGERRRPLPPPNR